MLMLSTLSIINVLQANSKNNTGANGDKKDESSGENSGDENVETRPDEENKKQLYNNLDKNTYRYEKLRQMH